MNSKVNTTRKLLTIVPMLSMFLLAGCQTAGNVPEETTHAVSPADEILALFDLYWELGEDAETGRAFMRRFREDPALVLEALTAATPFQREQMLVLIGSTITRAMRDDPIAHAEYSNALELAASLDLSEDSARMLGFIHANISHW